MCYQREIGFLGACSGSPTDVERTRAARAREHRYRFAQLQYHIYLCFHASDGRQRGTGVEVALAGLPTAIATIWLPALYSHDEPLTYEKKGVPIAPLLADEALRNRQRHSYGWLVQRRAINKRKCLRNTAQAEGGTTPKLKAGLLCTFSTVMVTTVTDVICAWL